jgi:curved DNA-binding protein
MNYYETLNVSRDATQDEIKKSYRTLVKEYHPDKTGGDDTHFKKISEAYEILGDPIKRRKHDGSNNSNSFNINDAWNDIFTRYDFTSAFDQSFGGDARGLDIRVSLNITIEESYEGTKRYIDVGTGGFNINIPKGIQNGTKLKIKEKGQRHPINSSARPGDIILTVNVTPDIDLIVNGSDIYVDLNLDWIDMLLGGDFEVKTKVHTVKIKVPQGSHDSKILRVVGKGMPIYNSYEYGNLMVKLRTLPINLSSSQIELLKKIKDSNG